MGARLARAEAYTALKHGRILVQVLYQHLSQPHIDLNWAPDGPGFKLTDAIRHSLRTPGALLHTRLQVRLYA